MAVRRGVAGGRVAAGELAGAETAGAEGGALTVAAGALLVAGVLVLGAAPAGVDGAEVEAVACGLELLLHPANATEIESATATDGQILEPANRYISSKSADHPRI